MVLISLLSLHAPVHRIPVSFSLISSNVPGPLPLIPPEPTLILPGRAVEAHSYWGRLT